MKWGLTRDIFVAWILTLPAAALIGALCTRVTLALFPPG